VRNMAISLRAPSCCLSEWCSRLENRCRVTGDGFMEGGEVRHMNMSVDDCDKVVFMVTTMRADETVRIMSFRRASEEEREQFYQNTGFRERV
jgi:uncharacterized DUF497 family protein